MANDEAIRRVIEDMLERAKKAGDYYGHPSSRVRTWAQRLEEALAAEPRCDGTVRSCASTAVLEELKMALRPVWRSGSVIDAAREACVRLAAEPQPPATLCPECGIGVRVDEESLCASCGAQCVGPGADRALGMIESMSREIHELRITIADMQRDPRPEPQPVAALERWAIYGGVVIDHLIFNTREGAERAARSLDSKVYRAEVRIFEVKE